MLSKKKTFKCDLFRNKMHVSEDEDICDPSQQASEAVDFKLEPEVQIKVENEDDLIQDVQNYNTNIPIDTEDDELRCPKCDITYMNKLSLKNHIQVCKTQPKVLLDHKITVNQYSNNNSLNANFVNGVRKVTEEEKKSLKILEQSCFNNKDKVAYDIRAESGINYKLDSVLGAETNFMFECEECDEMYSDLTKFARHCYAHTFIRIGKICSLIQYSPVERFK